MSAQQAERRFDVPAAAVHQAVDAQTHTAVRVIDRDDAQLSLVWQTKKSLFSWGHIVTAQIVPDGEGAILRLVVDGLPDAPRALMDRKKNASMAQRVLDDVAARLAEGSVSRRA